MDKKQMLLYLQSLERKLQDQQDALELIKHALAKENGAAPIEPKTARPDVSLKGASVPQPAAQKAPYKQLYTQSQVTAKKESEEDTEFWLGKYGLQIIGVVIFLIGAAFGLKYSIDQGLISPMIRFAFAMGTGCLMIGLAEVLHQQKNKWTDACLGGGIALCYGTTYYGHVIYALFGATTAITLCAAIGLAGAFFAVRYRSQVVAVLALLGSYLLPVYLFDTAAFALFNTIYTFVLLLLAMILACWYEWSGLARIAAFLAIIFSFVSSTVYVPLYIAGIITCFTLVPYLFCVLHTVCSFAPFSLLFSAGYSFYRLLFYLYPDWVISGGRLYELGAMLSLAFALAYGLLYLGYRIFKKQEDALSSTLVVLAISSVAAAGLFYFVGYQRILFLACYALLVYAVGTYVAPSYMACMSAIGLWAIAGLQIMFSLSLMHYNNKMTWTITLLGAALSYFIGAYIAQSKKVVHNKLGLPSMGEVLQLAGCATIFGWFMSPVWHNDYRLVGLTAYAMTLYCIGLYASLLLWRVMSYVVTMFVLGSLALQYHHYVYTVSPIVTHALFGALSIGFIAAALLTQRYADHLSEDEDILRNLLPAGAVVMPFLWGLAAIESYFYRQEDEALAAMKMPLKTMYYAVSSVVAILVGLIKRVKAIRYVGFGLVGLTLYSLFWLVFSFKETLYRIIAFLVIGLIFILVSFVYQSISKRFEQE